MATHPCARSNSVLIKSGTWKNVKKVQCAYKLDLPHAPQSKHLAICRHSGLAVTSKQIKKTIKQPR